MQMKGRIALVETPEFRRRAKGLMTEAEIADLVDYLSLNPRSGDLMAGTGGARKLRWASAGRGKSGSNRVIYYYCADDVPLFLLSVFAKDTKANLTGAEKIALKAVLGRLAASYRTGVRRHAQQLRR